jgi:hypothetical protein
MLTLHNNYKLTKVYTNDIWHQEAQEYLMLAYKNVDKINDIYHLFDDTTTDWVFCD